MCSPLTTSHTGTRESKNGVSTELVAEMSIGLAIAWSAVLVFDCVIFSLTAVRALRLWTGGRIVHVVLRDGVLYFW